MNINFSKLKFVCKLDFHIAIENNIINRITDVYSTYSNLKSTLLQIHSFTGYENLGTVGYCFASVKP